MHSNSYLHEWYHTRTIRVYLASVMVMFDVVVNCLLTIRQITGLELKIEIRVRLRTWRPPLTILNYEKHNKLRL